MGVYGVPAECHALGFTCTVSFHPPNNPRKHGHSHFTEEEAEAQGQLPSPGHTV